VRTFSEQESRPVGGSSDADILTFSAKTSGFLKIIVYQHGQAGLSQCEHFVDKGKRGQFFAILCGRLLRTAVKYKKFCLFCPIYFPKEQEFKSAAVTCTVAISRAPDKNVAWRYKNDLPGSLLRRCSLKNDLFKVFNLALHYFIRLTLMLCIGPGYEEPSVGYSPLNRHGRIERYGNFSSLAGSCMS